MTALFALSVQAWAYITVAAIFGGCAAVMWALDRRSRGNDFGDQ